MDAQNIPVFSVCGIAELERSIVLRKNWPPRSDLKPGDPNIVHEALVDRKKIIFPLQLIKLGLMKQFVN